MTPKLGVTSQSTSMYLLTLNKGAIYFMFKLFTRSGQIFFHNWRMFKQVFRNVLIAYFLIMAISFCGLAYYTSNEYELSAWKAHYIARMTSKWTNNMLNVLIIDHTGHEVIAPYKRAKILTDPYFTQQRDNVNHKLYWAFMMPFYSLTALFLCFAFLLVRRTKAKYSGEELVRGARVESPKVVNKILKTENRLSSFTLGIQHLVYDSEVKHIVLHGTTGTGKTVIIKDLLRQIRPRHHRAVILDDGGAYAQSFYDPSRGDIILNPFDARCPNWNAWDECVESIDFDNFAAALIPEEADKDKFWVQSARNLLSSLMQEMKKRGQISYESLLQHCLNLRLEVLQDVLKGTPAEQLVDGDIAKTALTIRAIITNHVKALRFLPQDKDRSSFSFREWVMNEHKNAKGACVFVVIRDKDIQAIRSLISLWIGLLTTHVKSLERSHQRRIWLILDELMKLNRLTSLPDTLATGRNYGLSCVLGIQNKAQLRATYGRDEAQAIFDLLSTQVFLRSPSAEIADEISKELGECEVIERLESNSYGAESVRDGISINPSRRTKRVVSYTEIQNMNDLEVYIKLPANVPRVKMKLSLSKKDVHRSDCFVERKIIANTAIEAQLKKTEAYHDQGLNFHAVTTEVMTVAGSHKANNNTNPSTAQTESKIDDRNNSMTDDVLIKNDDENNEHSEEIMQKKLNKHHVAVKANRYKVSEKEI